MALSNASSLPLAGDYEDAAVGNARAEYDRRHRSLPHPKHGPYRCPRCEELFVTSQVFAAHMKYHYKSESEEERRARMEEKQRRRGKPRGPKRAAGVGPVRVRKMRMKTLARNAPSVPVETESAELEEVEIEMDMEMEIKMEEDIQGIGSSLGIWETKGEPVV